MNAFARRTTLLGLGQVAVKGSQVLITIALVRMLAPDVWTATAFLLSVHLACTTVGSLNLHQSLLFFLPRAEGAHQRAVIVRTQLLLTGIGMVLGIAVVTLGGRVAPPAYQVHAALPLLALAIGAELVGNTLSPALIAADRIRAAAGWDVAMSSLQVMLVAGGGMAFGTAVGVTASLAAAAAVRMVLCVLATWAWFGPGGGELGLGLLGRQVAYCAPLGLALVVSVLNRSIDKWLVAAFSPGELGSYAVAAQEIPLVTILPTAGGIAVAARIATAFRDGAIGDARTIWYSQSAALTQVVVPTSMLLVLVAPEAMRAALGAGSGAAVVPFQLFSAITLHRVAEYGLALRCADRTPDLVRASVVLLVANAALASFGASRFGATGAAAGTLAANVVAWGYALALVGRAFGCSVARVFPWSAWSGWLAASMGAASVASVAARFVAPASLHSACVKVVVFGGVMALFALRSHVMAPGRPAVTTCHSPSITGLEQA